MSLRRPGMASPALAALASCFLFRMRVSTPSVAVEDIVYRVSCARRCATRLPRTNLATKKTMFFELKIT